MVVRKKKGNSKKINENLKDFNKQIEWGVDTLMTLVENHPKRNSLIDNGSSIFLQVSVFKIPEVEELVKRRIVLKHPPYAPNPEVCFIAHDCIRRDRVKRTDDEMIEYTVDCFEEYFKKQKVTGITNILPFRQLKCEYDTYELRRKLVNRFDVFLCSSFLNNHDNFFKCLGKHFIQKNKFPIPVKLPKLKSDYRPQVNKIIQAAISSTIFRIKEGSANYCIKFGNTLNEKKAIKENLKVVMDKIVGPDSEKLIPGGFGNIRLMCLKTVKSKSVPIYVNLDSGRKIPVPYVGSNVPVRKSVEGELSTTLNKKVTVLPSGDIFVTDIEDKSDNENSEDEEDDMEEELQDDEEEDDEIDDLNEKERKKEFKKSRKRTRENISDNEDEDEDVEAAIETAEQNYLLNWNEDQESSEDEHSKKVTKKKSKLNEKLAKKEKKNESPPTKKLKKGDIKSKLDPIYRQLGKEKIKINKNKSNTEETVNSEQIKKKKTSEKALVNKIKKDKTKVKEVAKKEKKQNKQKNKRKRNS